MEHIIFGYDAVIVPMELYKFFGNVNDAFIVQFIHESNESSEAVLWEDGEYWFAITNEELSKRLPMSMSTVKRSLSELRSKGYLLSECLTGCPWDRTKSYRVNYEKLENDLKEWGK